MTNTTKEYDVVVVGAGIAGSIIAKKLGEQGKSVLVLESGPLIGQDESLSTFYKANAKTPESPYPPVMQNAVEASEQNPLGLPDPKNQNAPRHTVLQIGAWRNSKQSYFDYTPQDSGVTGESLNTRFAFGSSYERVGGGTTRHWLGTSLQHLPNDFQLKTKYGKGVDWPGGDGFYQKLLPFYQEAVREIGVSAVKAKIVDLYRQFNVEPDGKYGANYDYPMRGIEQSLLDQSYVGLSNMTYEGNPIYVTPTPQARNSPDSKEGYTCEGNTNCIPICPVQAKYDARRTISSALQTGNVDVLYKHVASNIKLDDDRKVAGIEYLVYPKPGENKPKSGIAIGKRYVLAAHAIETPKLLLMSNKNPGFEKGVANSSDQVGRNLMDHVMYLGWGLSAKGKPVYPYRGPLSTSGIESLRDGGFRKDRSAYRIEIGNEGWQWAANDPGTTLADFVFGQNNSQLNGNSVNESGDSLIVEGGKPFSKLFGKKLISTLNDVYTRQIRLGFLIEQLPDPENRVQLSEKLKDNLGLPRPLVTYRLASDYERKGFVSAKEITTKLFDAMGATEYTKAPDEPVLEGESHQVTATNFQYTAKDRNTGEDKTHNFRFFGAGHIVGTYRMGDNKDDSVLNSRQQSWDHENLYMVGSGVFPTIATGNPTLTIAALALQAAENILEDLSE